MNRISKIIMWSPVILLIAIFTLFTFILLSEWWNIKILNQTDNYAWGPTNENPWFYETPNLYANVQLVKGLMMLFLTLMTVRKITKNKKSYKYWLFSGLIFIIMIYFSSNIR